VTDGGTDGGTTVADGGADGGSTGADGGTFVLCAAPKHQAFASPVSVDLSVAGGISGAAGALAIGDMDRDGKPDVVYAGSGSSVGYVAGDANGALKAPQSFSTGSQDVWAIALGDVNGDGILDVAVTHHASGGLVTVMLGQAGGTLKHSWDYLGGDWPSAAVIADFNGDGKPDIAVANDVHPGSVSILLNNGSGAFGLPSSYACGGEPRHLVAADVDGDGILDLVTANNYDASASVLWGIGDGTFASPVTLNTGLGPNGVAVADVNLDGKLDVVVADQAVNQITLVLGAGSRTFLAPRSFGGGFQTNAVAVGDVDADGVPDLAIADGPSFPLQSNLGIQLGQGGGVFGTPSYFPTDFSTTSVALVHLDGDPWLDVVLGNSMGLDLTVFTGTCQ
jgi:hypothetical protein